MYQTILKATNGTLLNFFKAKVYPTSSNSHGSPNFLPKNQFFWLPKLCKPFTLHPFVVLAAVLADVDHPTWNLSTWDPTWTREARVK